jgi:hypothetical protein
MLQELVTHGLDPILQPPVVGLQGLDKGVKGVVLVSVPATLGAQLVEAVVPLSSSALQLLSLTDKAKGEAESEEAQAQKRRERGEGKTPKSNRKNVYQENPPHGTYVDSQRLVQCVVE